MAERPRGHDPDRPHFFVCYSHRDRKAVFAELLALEATGLNFWFDEGMDPGSEWPAELAAAISTCKGMLFFVSPTSVASRNCCNEVQYARDHNKPIVAVYLEDTALPPALQLTLATTHALQRYASDRDTYRRQLVAALKDESVMSVATHRGTFWTPRNRERAFWGVALVAAVFVSAFALRATDDAAVPRQARFSIAVPDAVEITPESYFEMFVPPPLAISPDARTIVYSARDESGRSALYRRDLDQFDAQRMPGTDGGTSPFFSPDGEWVGFVVDRTMMKVPLEGGTAETIVPALAAAGFGGADWGPDDMIVYSESAVSGLFVVPANGGVPVQVSRPNGAAGELSQVMPQYLPSGDAVLLSVRMGMAPEAPTVQVLSLETGELRTLLNEAIGARYVDGRVIYGGSGQATGSLWIASFDAQSLELRGDPARVLEGVAADLYALPYFQLSATGSLAYIPTGDSRPVDEIVWVENGEQQGIANSQYNYAMPSLSPDESRIAVTTVDDAREMQTWLIDPDRGAPVMLRMRAQNTHSHVWMPDGESFVFTADHEGPSNLYLKEVDASTPAVRLTNSEQHHDAASFSPDGNLLTYAEMHPESNWDLWMLDMTTGETRPILNTDAEEIQPIISPRGDLLAYTTNETGRREVYVEQFPGGGRKRRVSSAGGEDPVWGRDGSLLYYRWLDSIYAVPNTAGGFGDPERVYQGRFEGRAGYGKANWDVDAEGRFLLTSQLAMTVAPRINVILDWLVEE